MKAKQDDSGPLQGYTTLNPICQKSLSSVNTMRDSFSAKSSNCVSFQPGRSVLAQTTSFPLPRRRLIEAVASIPQGPDLNVVNRILGPAFERVDAAEAIPLPRLLRL
jgi:hypothetical protein